MKRVRAQFRPDRRPSRGTWIAIAVLAAGVAALGGAATWQARRVQELGVRLAEVAEARKSAAAQVPARPEPPYGDSARLFLRARGAAWAPALRSLESAAMIGVTSVRLEFDGAEGTARVELEYRDAATLHDYLSRLNDGLPASSQAGRWTLLETHVQVSATQPAVAGTGTVAADNDAGTAIIQSSWR
ncbi:MAG: hypothetical protein ACTHL8_12235 [Burkholderiaceae bacterium]